MSDAIVWDILVSLGSNAASAGIAFAIALWKGDEIADYFREKRRVRQWQRIGKAGKAHLETALMQAMISIPVNAAWQLPKLPPDAPRPADAAAGAARVFRGWAAQLEELEARGIDFNEDQQLQALMDREPAAAQLLGMLPALAGLFGHVASRLRDEYMLFNSAFPADWNQALIQAIGELRGAAGQVRPYDVTPQTEHIFGIRAVSNLAWSARAVAALGELARVISDDPGEPPPLSSIRVTTVIGMGRPAPPPK